MLLTSNFLLPSASLQQATLSRTLFVFCNFVGEVLEMGAYYSIKIKDIPAFERYMSQLQSYYQNAL